METDLHKVSHAFKLGNQSRATQRPSHILHFVLDAGRFEVHTLRLIDSSRPETCQYSNQLGLPHQAGRLRTRTLSCRIRKQRL